MANPSTPNRTDIVRKILADAEDSMTAAEVREAMKKAGHPFIAGDAAWVLRQRRDAGEFICNTVDGEKRYTLNPEFVQKKGGRPPGVAPANSPARRAPASILAPALGVAPVAALPFSESRDELLAIANMVQPMSEAEIRATADAWEQALVPLAGVRSLDEMQPLPATAAGPRNPMAMRERLAAIANDIEDALGDACDARLDHGLIKALVVANGAVQRGARALGV